MTTPNGLNVLPFEVPIFEMEKKVEELESFSKSTEMDLSAQIRELRARCDDLKRDIFRKLTPWQRVQLARHPNRPGLTDYLTLLFEDVVELHGDRAFGDDKAVFTGFAKLGGRKVLLVGHRKGKGTKDRMVCNFGSAHPEGYRKAMLKMRLAAHVGLPVVSFINTPGAYPGIGAEERGQAQVIAANLMEMSQLPVPVVCVVIGEGGSGGALGIGVGDRLLMMENAYYSVISPEGCSAILWKTGDKVEQAAAGLKLTAQDLLRFGIADEVVAEPLGGAHRGPVEIARTLKGAILRHLEELDGLPSGELLDRRYEKYRKIGVWREDRAAVGSRAPEADARDLR